MILVWPWPFRLSLETWPEVPALQRLVQLPIEFALVGSGLTILAVVFLVAPATHPSVRCTFSSWLQAAPRSAFSP